MPGGKIFSAPEGGRRRNTVGAVVGSKAPRVAAGAKGMHFISFTCEKHAATDYMHAVRA